MAHFVRALGGEVDRVEYRLRFPDGGVRWVESALRGSESQYRTLIERSSDGIFILDTSGRVVMGKPAAQELVGLEMDPLHALRITDLFDPEEGESDPYALENLAAGRTIRTVRRLKSSSHDRWVWAELSARSLGDGRVQAMARDITERVEAARQIEDFAHLDSLTGLPNRDHSREQIDHALDRCRRGNKQFALLFLDIDRFKQVNDSLGHSRGDALLAQVGDRLRSALRGGDSISRAMSPTEASKKGKNAISRLGGDEFTILIPDLDHPQGAARVALRVLHSFSRPYSIADHEIFVGGSIGIAVWPDDGADSDELLRSADTAMCHAKNRGGNVYEFFNASMNVTSSRRSSRDFAARSLATNSFRSQKRSA